MSKVFRIGPARLIVATNMQLPISDWIDMGYSSGDCQAKISPGAIARGKVNQFTAPVSNAIHYAPGNMGATVPLVDHQAAKLLKAFPGSVRVTSGAKEALQFQQTPGSLTPLAVCLIPELDNDGTNNFFDSEFCYFWEKAFLMVEEVKVGGPVENGEQQPNAFQVVVTRCLDQAGAQAGLGYPFLNTNIATPLGCLFSYQPTIDGLTPAVGSAATFSRASTATYVDANGIIQTATTNTPRYQDGGLLLEPQRTNVLDISTPNGSWTTSRSSASTSAATAPDGSAGATKLVEDGTSGEHYLARNITKAASAITYSVTMYAKPAGRDFAFLTAMSGANGCRVWFNLSSGVVGSSTTFGSGWTATSATITSAGNGWYRCAFVVTSDTTTTITIRASSSTGDTTVSYTGDGASGVYLWGAQVEAGSYPTSYIPTSGSTVTRNADVFSAPRPSGLSVQSDFSAIINAVPLFGDGEEAASTQFRLFGDASPRVNALYPSGTPDRYYSEFAGFTVDSSEAVLAGTFTRNEDMEAMYVSDADGNLTYTIVEGGTAATPASFAWSAVKNATDAFGGTAIIQYQTGSWILKSFIVTSGLLTYDQIRSYLRA